MKYSIRPLDVLSFNDGRPFGYADDHRLHLAFPPSPATIYGALRAAFMGQHERAFIDQSAMPDETKIVAGTKDAFGSLSITDIGFLLNGSKPRRLFLTPRDIVRDKLSKAHVVLAPHANETGCTTNMPDGIAELAGAENSETGFFEQAEAFITADGLKNYLTGTVPSADDFVPLSDFYLKENRTGIEIQKFSRTVKEGALYTIEFARLSHGARFIIETDYPVPVGLLKLGAEGKSAHVEHITLDNDLPDVECRNGLRVIVVTPLHSAMGWQPDASSVAILESKLRVKLTLRSAVVGNYRSIGGWDIQHRRPKTHRRFIGEGSVFYFSIDGADHGRSSKNAVTNISTDENDRKQGFGLTILGGY